MNGMIVDTYKYEGYKSQLENSVIFDWRKLFLTLIILMTCSSCGKYGRGFELVCNMKGDSITIKTFKSEHKNVIVLPEVCRSKETESISKADVYYSNLPTCHISINNKVFEIIKQDPKYKVFAEMKLYDANSNCEYCGDIRIHTRGNGTYKYAAEKKPYNIKLDNKLSILGMQATKSYCLLNNIFDESMIRNVVAFDIAKEMKLITPDYSYVQLFINGNYQGLYLLTNKINIPDVVPIADLDADNKIFNRAKLGDYPVWETEEGRAYLFDENPEDITGGYLLELSHKGQYTKSPCWFISNNGEIVRVRAPKYISKEELEYIRLYWNKFESSSLSNDSLVYYADISSFAKYYLLNEFCMNHDFGHASTYIYKDSGHETKFVAGPAWDYDVCFFPYFWSHYIREINEIYAGSKHLEKTLSGGIFYNLCNNEIFINEVVKIYDEFLRNRTFTQKIYFDIQEASFDRKRWANNLLYKGNGAEMAQREIYVFLSKRQKFLSWYYSTSNDEKIRISINTFRRVIQLYAPKKEGYVLPDVYQNVTSWPNISFFDGYEDVATGKIYKVGDVMHDDVDLQIHFRTPNRLEALE